MTAGQRSGTRVVPVGLVRRATQPGAHALLAAAQHQDRVTAVVSIGGWARLIAPPDDPGIGIPRASLEAFVAKALEHWGTGKGIAVMAPSAIDDALFRERWATFERRAASPGAFQAYSQMLGDIDVRHVLDDVTVPVLLTHSQVTDGLGGAEPLHGGPVA